MTQVSIDECPMTAKVLPVLSRVRVEVTTTRDDVPKFFWVMLNAAQTKELKEAKAVDAGDL